MSLLSRVGLSGGLTSLTPEIPAPAPYHGPGCLAILCAPDTEAHSSFGRAVSRAFSSPCAIFHAPSPAPLLVAEIDAVRRRYYRDALPLLAVGAGARLALSYAVAHPRQVGCLVLVAPMPTRLHPVAPDFTRTALLLLGGGQGGERHAAQIATVRGAIPNAQVDVTLIAGAGPAPLHDAPDEVCRRIVGYFSNS